MTAASSTLADALAAVARAAPDQVALWLPRGRRHRPGPAGFAATTYAELDQRVDALAAGFTAIGVGPGVRTALLVPPGPDFFAVVFGLNRAGAVPVLVDPGMGLRRLRECLRRTALAAFVGVPRAHAARRLLGWCPTADRLVTVGPPLPGGGRTLAAVERAGAGRPVERAAPAPDALAAIAFTSGSTGPPKGVEYTHAQFAAQVELVRALYAAQPGAVSLATFPPFALLGPLLGLTTVVPRMDPTRPGRVDPRRVVDAANAFGASVMFGSPALLDRVGRHGAATGARLPTMRRVVSAGAPVPAAVQERVVAMLPAGGQVHTPYGATEALPVSTIGSDELRGLDEIGVCVGRPVDGVDVAVVRIVDGPLPRLTPDLLVPPGEVGEIVVRGPNVTTAYADDPAATALAKTDWDGVVAHRMGDLGRLDGAGRLWFCGRASHRVRTAAGTLVTSPAEEVVNAHPAVARAALVGVGPPGAQRPVVCVDLERGARPTPALTRELLHLTSGHPATAAVADVLYSPGFPVDVRHNAKIDRPAVAAWAARRLR